MDSNKEECRKCGLCCFKTEMIFSEKEREIILRNSGTHIKKKDFCFEISDGIYQLKNTNGTCFFFNSKTMKCKIYRYRPMGCRFYPIIYDLKEDRCILDKDCPHPQVFIHDSKLIAEKCKELKYYLQKQLKLKLKKF